MRFIFRTSYNQDVDLFQHRGQVFWYVLLVATLFLAPFFLSRFLIGELSELFIWAIAGCGLMILVGYTGLVSLGHAAFMAIGAYAHVILVNAGVPFGVSMLISAVITGLIGAVLGVAALRMTGIYLAVATFSFAYIVEKVIGKWTGLTGGHRGLMVEQVEIFGASLGSGKPLYFLCLFVLVVVLMALLNVLRSPLGRAFVAVRDSEISAQAMGVNLVKTKTMAFALSAAITGLAGALYSQKIGFLFPESFTIIVSIKLLMLVVVGGLGSMHGAIFGAMFIVLLPQCIALLRDYLPTFIATRQGLEPFAFGLILIIFLVFEPLGIYGRWVKIRTYFSNFPLYRKSTYKRQRSFLRTERVH